MRQDHQFALRDSLNLESDASYVTAISSAIAGHSVVMQRIALCH